MPTNARRPLTAWDSPGFLLWHATLRWQREVRAALRPLGLTHAQFVLLAGTAWLGRNGEAPSQRELAAHAGTNIMMTSQVVRTLGERGLVRHGPDPADARVRRISASAEGVRVARRAIDVVEAVDERYFGSVAAGLDLIATLRVLAGRQAVDGSAGDPSTAGPGSLLRDDRRSTSESPAIT